jgi:CRISPR-associated RAMP protein (TIGR02581 family)
MNNIKTFDKLESRYIFRGVLVLEEAMHIGSGKGDEFADSTFVKSGDKFYIPGSSLRGALRSTVERIAYTLLEKNTCLLYDKSSHPTCVTVNPEVIKDKKNEAEIVKILENNLCDTCKVFGSTHFASKVKITDLYPINGNPKDNIRFGVGIDRDTETASQGALFEIQVLEKGHCFDFELIAENLSGKTEWGLLCIGLHEMMRDKANGGAFYIGAKSASGLGRCQLTDLKISYFDIQCPDYNLKNYLLNDKLGQIADAESFIQTKITEFLN